MQKMLYSLFFLVGLTSCFGDRKDYDSIIEVVKAPLKTNAFILGVVVSEPGLYDGFLNKGFGLADRSGGIFVETEQIESLKRGDQVEVKGEVSDLYGMKVLRAQAIAMISKKYRIRSHIKDLRNDQLNAGHVGQLIRVHGKMEKMVPELPFGWHLQVKAQSGQNIRVMISSSSKIEPRDDERYRKSAQVTITGFAVLFKEKVFILPRDPKDVLFR